MLGEREIDDTCQERDYKGKAGCRTDPFNGAVPLCNSSVFRSRLAFRSVLVSRNTSTVTVGRGFWVLGPATANMPPQPIFINLSDEDTEDSRHEADESESDEDDESFLEHSGESSHMEPSDSQEDYDSGYEDSECESDYRLDSDCDELETDEARERRGRIPFQNDVQNVEFPVCNEDFPLTRLPGRIEEKKPKQQLKHKRHPHFMLYLVGEELEDGGSTSATATGTCPGLQNVVWQALAEEVVEAVLLWLPAAAQARCRAVCKSWCALLTNPEFLRRSFLQSISRSTPPLCAVRYCPKVLLKPWVSEQRLQRPPLYKVLNVGLSFLPEVFHSSCSVLHSRSACGFMCISRLVDEGMLVCVLNPVNESFKVLPLLQKLWGHHVVVLLGTVSATESILSFKVYVTGVGPVQPVIIKKLYEGVAIYSSISGEWKGFSGRSEVEASESRPLACNGGLYTMVDSTPPRLVRLSTEPGLGYLWDVALPHFEKRRGENWGEELFLAGHRGRLLCCCSGGIWMLDDAANFKLWVAIAGMCPPDILPPCTSATKWLRLKNVHVVGDFVLFFYQVGLRRCDEDDDLVHPVAFDLLRGCWRNVPQAIAQAGDVFQPMPNLTL